MTLDRARCELHTGEAYPPRCEECDAAAAEERTAIDGASVGFGWPVPAEVDSWLDDVETP